jgi:hypothetical protein
MITIDERARHETRPFCYTSSLDEGLQGYAGKDGGGAWREQSALKLFHN